MSMPILIQGFINPADRELVDYVKKAACKHFEIDEQTLVDDKTPTVAQIRFMCFFLIYRNSQLKDKMIGQLFNRKRNAVNYGIELMDMHKNIYRQTLDNLRKIADIANNFDKNYSWYIQPINTNS